LKTSGGTLFEVVRMDLIAKYLEAEGVFMPLGPATSAITTKA
jgi:hypothetical protein